MKSPFSPLRYFAFTSCFLLAMPAAHAELPAFTEKPWLGYFLAIKDRKSQFSITSKGKAALDPLKRDGTPLNIFNGVKVNFEIRETMPDGKIVRKNIKPDTLASPSPATLNPTEPVTITGKTTGDAKFELSIIPDRRGFALSGRVIENGTLTNPLNFAISIDFTPYRAEKRDKDEEKKFMKKIRRDEIRATTVDGKRAKLSFSDEGNPATAYPEGFNSVEIRTEGYAGLGFQLDASENSKIVLEDKGDRPLHKGFSLIWTVNENADPKAEQFTIGTK